MCFVVGCVAGRRNDALPATTSGLGVSHGTSQDAGTILQPATTSGLGVSQGTSVEESQADSNLVPLTSVQGERCPGDSRMHTNYGANLPSPPLEVSGATWATPKGR